MRAGFQSGGAAGLDVYGDGRGCNTVFGSLTVNSIDSTPSGEVDFVDASFTQECDAATNPALTGTIRYAAPPAGRPAVSLAASAAAVTTGSAVTFSTPVSSAAGRVGGAASPPPRRP